MTQKDLGEALKRRAAELKSLRESKNISKTKLSEISGLARSAIINMEQGNNCWRVDTEIIFMNALNSITIRTRSW